MGLRRTFWLVAVWALGVAFAACAFPEVTIGPAGTGAGGQGGDDGECSAASDCAIPSDPCEVATCEGQTCGVAARQQGEACGTDLVCNVDGKCVECEGPGDCGAEACVQGECVPLTCDNGMPDTGETDEDCGGMDCPPCMNGKMCMVGSDCLSGICTGNLCTTCMQDSDCEAVGLGTYCDDGACVPKLEIGVSCVNDNDCQSGNCPSDDNVCCDVACDDECEGCEKAKTGEDTGTCAPILSGTDPDKECGLGNCGAGSLCIL